VGGGGGGGVRTDGLVLDRRRGRQGRRSWTRGVDSNTVAVERTAGREGGVDREGRLGETGRKDENEPFDRHLTSSIRTRPHFNSKSNTN
jgi:hypothetical protein